MFLIGLITAFVVALCFLYSYFKFVVFTFWRKKGVFYIDPVVPTGNVTSLLIGKISLGELFHDIYLKYKNHRAIGTYIFFKPNLVIADLDLVRIVLTKEFASFHDRGFYSNEKVEPLSGNLFLLPGRKWRNLRAKLTTTFTSGNLKQMFGVLKKNGEELAISLKKITETEDCIDIREIFARYTTDVIMSAAFGIKSKCMTTPDSEFLYQAKKLFETHNFWIALFAFVPQIPNFFAIPFLNRNTSDFFIKVFQNTVQYRLTHNIVRHDFMNLLMQLMEKGYMAPDEEDTSDSVSNTSKISILEAAAQAYAFIIGGFETASTAATFCLYELAINQDVQNKLRQEIDEVLKKHGEVTYNAVNDMTYLHKVVSETLRKYPPVPIVNRVCTKAINFPTTDIHIPEGTLMSISVFGIHRDPAIYPNPDKFDPERFNKDQIAARHPYAYLPFGEGPRTCIGQRFGYMQTKVGVINILLNFKFKLHPKTSVPLIIDGASVLCTPKGGVHLIIEPL
ncbi:probable cytochrome P450 6a14 [Pseudomyrmex gracilis]|uniref:probable cytochrome P450 6a14 n=1 Tax=Pseudomyrmex gracilis TaxID=219809 RepID=UPI000995B90E|nr:probable cytochrome P450 6a14 [Pseudomyrmex gracilis]